MSPSDSLQSGEEWCSTLSSHIVVYISAKMVDEVIYEDGESGKRASEVGVRECRDVVRGGAICEMISPFVPSPFSRPLRWVFNPEFWVGSDFLYVELVEFGDVSRSSRYKGSRRGSDGRWTHTGGEMGDGKVAVRVDIRGK